MALSRSWVINSRGLAKIVLNAGLPDAYDQIKDCGANIQCPKSHYLIDNSDICDHEWPGLPAGVKFDPSDVELLDDLPSKQGVGKWEPHVFIDEFIPTLIADEGICYTHPQNLPGVKKDGSSIHFFHKTVNACASGKKKRRRVEDEESTITVRWHKTCKTKPVMENGIQKGFKKIMVLYPKSDKCNWVMMHQYHLGTDEDEKEGEYVVSKIFYQQPAEKETHHKNGKPAALLMEESHVITNPPLEEDDFIHSFLQFEGVDSSREDSQLCNQIYVALGDLDNIELNIPPDFWLTDLQFDSQDSMFGWC